MKSPWIKTSVVLSALLYSGPVLGVAGGVDPGYVNVKVYEIRLSRSADCTDAITVYRNDSPSYQDWTDNPTIGSGALPNGTYHCVMMRMSDYIHFTPSEDHPNWTRDECIVGQDEVLDVGHDEVAINPDGTTQTLGPDGTENIVWLYVRTGGGATNGNAWSPEDGIALTSPLVVNGDGARTVVFDFSNQVSETQDMNSNWICGCEAPTMSFR